MTTIVYSNNEMAWDSRITAGGKITTDNAQKRYTVAGRTFWCAGTVGDMQEFCDSFESRRVGRELDVQAFVLDAGKLFISATEEDRIWTSPVVDSRAIGSGCEHAITAIDCGKTPAEAIKLAAKRDTYTGGKIRTQKLKLS